MSTTGSDCGPSTRRRRRRAATALVGLIAAASMGTSQAFVAPRSPAHLPTPSHHLSSTSARARIRAANVRKPRSSGLKPLFVSLEPPSTAPSENDELLGSELVELLNISEQSNATSPKLVESMNQSNATLLPDPVVDLIEDVSEKLAQDAFIPAGETEERHMERARMGDDVEELTHLLAHDEADLQPLVAPSVPVSYDENGMVQADAAPAVSMAYLASTNGAVSFGVNGGSTSLAAENEPDYPAFIKFLYQRDENGRTLASKLFNAALLLASFGYVATLVFSIDKGMTRGWTPAEIGMRIPLDTWASYENSLSEKPVATKTIINIVIYLLGDWLSQTLFQSKNVLDFDAGRTLKNGFVGMCFGPAVHEYYEFSDWILPVDGATLGITNRAFKILMDQTIYLSVKCSIYILAVGVLSGDTVEESADNVKNRIKPIMFTAWKFWPLVHCVTYGLIPARHRILWVNSVDLVWNAILASKARTDDDDESEGELNATGQEGEISVMDTSGDVTNGEMDVSKQMAPTGNSTSS